REREEERQEARALASCDAREREDESALARSLLERRTHDRVAKPLDRLEETRIGPRAREEAEAMPLPALRTRTLGPPFEDVGEERVGLARRPTRPRRELRGIAFRRARSRFSRCAHGRIRYLCGSKLFREHDEHREPEVTDDVVLEADPRVDRLGDEGSEHAQEKPAKGAGKDEKQRVDIRGLGAHRRTVAQLDEHGIVLEHDPLGLQMAKLAELILVARLETL